MRICHAFDAMECRPITLNMDCEARALSAAACRAPHSTVPLMGMHLALSVRGVACAPPSPPAPTPPISTFILDLIND